ncbi:MAG TPA: argininosuccinate lyase [bacterium]|nr:argininosuccinate lyase [bacterium]
MTLYEGRIGEKADALMDAINRSLPVDIRLLPYDVATNQVWARELRQIGVYNEAELASVLDALEKILTQYRANAFTPLPDDEDVHTLIERLLTESLGELGARIHTGRSRNDQVACDLRLFLMDRLPQLSADIRELIAALLDIGREHRDTLLAGETHLQPAQPITLGHFLLSLAFGLRRDVLRISDALQRIRRCPLGSGALAGAGFTVDRERLSHELGFDAPLENSLDATADRDAAQETVGALAIMATRLSRYAEQFIIWTSPAFGYVRFADRWSTGSSMMPQKRNPDAMELIRAKAARVIGQSTALLTLTKGVPLAYAKDLQEDKTALFDALDTAFLIVNVFREATASATFNVENMLAKLGGDLLATDLADLLTQTGVPFRTAHQRVARFVGLLEKDHRDLLSATDDELNEAFPELPAVKNKLTFAAAVSRRSVAGGPSPTSLEAQFAQLTAWLREMNMTK